MAAIVDVYDAITSARSSQGHAAHRGACGCWSGRRTTEPRLVPGPSSARWASTHGRAGAPGANASRGAGAERRQPPARVKVIFHTAATTCSRKTSTCAGRRIASSARLRRLEPRPGAGWPARQGERSDRKAHSQACRRSRRRSTGPAAIRRLCGFMIRASASLDGRLKRGQAGRTGTFQRLHRASRRRPAPVAPLTPCSAVFAPARSSTKT